MTTPSFNSLNQLESISGGGRLKVAGTTDEPVIVTVQGEQARMVSPTEFVANPQVTTGTNTISVVATDGSGNARTNVYAMVVSAGANRTFSYDGNGNLLTEGERVCEWDGLDRLVKVTRGGDICEFTYDGFGRRVEEKVNGTVTKKWIWKWGQKWGQCAKIKY